MKKIVNNVETKQFELQQQVKLLHASYITGNLDRDMAELAYRAVWTRP